MSLSTTRAGVIGAALLAALVGSLPTTVNAQKPSTDAAVPAERPIYVIGDTWSRSDGVWELRRIEGDHPVMKGEMEGVLPLTRVGR